MKHFQSIDQTTMASDDDEECFEKLIGSLVPGDLIYDEIDEVFGLIITIKRGIVTNTNVEYVKIICVSDNRIIENFLEKDRTINDCYFKKY